MAVELMSSFMSPRASPASWISENPISTERIPGIGGQVKLFSLINFPKFPSGNGNYTNPKLLKTGTAPNQSTFIRNNQQEKLCVIDHCLVVCRGDKDNSQKQQLSNSSTISCSLVVKTKVLIENLSVDIK